MCQKTTTTTKKQTNIAGALPIAVMEPCYRYYHAVGKFVLKMQLANYLAHLVTAGVFRPSSEFAEAGLNCQHQSY